MASDRPQLIRAVSKRRCADCGAGRLHRHASSASAARNRSWRIRVGRLGTTYSLTALKSPQLRESFLVVML